MLIPFGMKDGRLYDVSEVDGGRACGCICPSCKQRLVARKGDPLKRVHHFAHDASATKNSDKKECEFSFFVAARLLIKQRLEESGGCEVNLPDGHITLSSKDVFGIERSVTYSYTTSSQVNLEDLRIEEKWGDLDVDVVGCLGGFHIGFRFVYDGRPSVPMWSVDTKKALVEIDLTELLVIYRELKSSEGNAFKDIVLDYVLNSGPREWKYHPRYAKAHQHAEKSLAEKIEHYNCTLFGQDSEGNNVSERYYGQGGYICKRCQRAWLEEDYGRTCPNCYLSGERFCSRPKKQTLKGLAKLRHRKICLKCQVAAADIMGEICSSCYESCKEKGQMSVKAIVKEIVDSVMYGE